MNSSSTRAALTPQVCEKPDDHDLQHDLRRIQKTSWCRIISTSYSSCFTFFKSLNFWTPVYSISICLIKQVQRACNAQCNIIYCSLYSISDSVTYWKHSLLLTCPSSPLFGLQRKYHHQSAHLAPLALNLSGSPGTTVALLKCTLSPALFFTRRHEDLKDFSSSLTSFDSDLNQCLQAAPLWHSWRAV